MPALNRERSATGSDAARQHLALTLLAVGGEDREAFKELYRLTNAKLFGICRRICGDTGNAEDVLHEVYLLIWKRAGAWQPGQASPITWLCVITRNRCIDWCRAQAIRPAASSEPLPDLFDDRPNPETALLAKDENIHLMRCMKALEVRRRDAISRAFFDGVTYTEVAAHAGVPVGTVKSWIRRGLRQLHSCLGCSESSD